MVLLRRFILVHKLLLLAMHVAASCIWCSVMINELMLLLLLKMAIDSALNILIELLLVV